MALQFLESFDYYGTIAEAALGRWTIAGFNTKLITSQSRTGTTSLSVGPTSSTSTAHYARLYLPTPQTEIGVAFGIRLTQFTGDNGVIGVWFRGTADADRVKVTVQSDGSIGVYKYVGSAYVLIGNTAPVITLLAWYHIEIRMLADSVVGEIEVAVNGATVLLLTNMDFGNDVIPSFDFNSIRIGGSSYARDFAVDDVAVWDKTGTTNKTLLGPVSVVTLLPDADTVAADWAVVGAVAGYDAINNIPPDGSTTYISSSNVTDVSEFGFANVPAEVANIIGAGVVVQAQLDSAGVGAITTGLISGAAISEESTSNLPIGWVYRSTIHELDPNTVAAWTNSGLNAALFRLTKSA